MEQTVSLDDYLKSFDKDDVIIKKALKDAMVWELVEDEWKSYKGADLTDKTEKSKEKEEDLPEGFDESNHKDDKKESSEPEESNDDEEFSEEDLLKELDEL